MSQSDSKGDGGCVSQGAEAHIYTTSLSDVVGPWLVGEVRGILLKERKPKAYRLPELDCKLRSKRTTQEARCLVKARRAGVLAPCLVLCEPSLGRIYMEKVEGVTAKAWLREREGGTTAVSGAWEQSLQLARAMGSSVAKLHDVGIVHGDLTTSNFIVAPHLHAAAAAFLLYVIDFGLASSVSNAEDRAVDLYVLERAFLSTHPNSETLMEALMDEYKSCCKSAKGTLQKLESVRQRGRKREMLG